MEDTKKQKTKKKTAGIGKPESKMKSPDHQVEVLKQSDMNMAYSLGSNSPENEINTEDTSCTIRVLCDSTFLAHLYSLNMDPIELHKHLCSGLGVDRIMLLTSKCVYVEMVGVESDGAIEYALNVPFICQHARPVGGITCLKSILESAFPHEYYLGSRDQKFCRKMRKSFGVSPVLDKAGNIMFYPSIEASEKEVVEGEADPEYEKCRSPLLEFYKRVMANDTFAVDMVPWLEEEKRLMKEEAAAKGLEYMKCLFKVDIKKKILEVEEKAAAVSGVSKRKRGKKRNRKIKNDSDSVAVKFYTRAMSFILEHGQDGSEEET